MRRILAVFAFVSACGTPFDFGGQELGVSPESDELADGAYEADTCSEGTVEPALTATGGAGSIDVSHSFDGDCCAEWVPSAVVSETEDWVIDLAYANDAAACDCTCGFTLEYTLEDVPAGDWTVRGDGLEATVTVE